MDHLTNYVALYIPAITKMVEIQNLALHIMIQECGGCTTTEGSGWWRDSRHDLFEDPIVIYKAFTTADKVIPLRNRLLKTVGLQMLARGEQTVGIEQDGTFDILTQEDITGQSALL